MRMCVFRGRKKKERISVTPCSDRSIADDDDDDDDTHTNAYGARLIYIVLQQFIRFI